MACLAFHRQLSCRHGAGFSLVELLLVITLALVLLSVGVPSLRAWTVKRALQQTAEALVSDLRLARSEAVKRGALVAVCASVNGQSCAASEGTWADGWLVFVDRNGNRGVDAGEDILRVQARSESVASLGSLNPATDKRIFSYQATGWAKVAAQTFLIKPVDVGTATADLTRLVCVSNQGRPSLRPAGTTQCS